jgi:hypothetical protein
VTVSINCSSSKRHAPHVDLCGSAIHDRRVDSDRAIGTNYMGGPLIQLNPTNGHGGSIGVTERASFWPFFT